MMTPLSRSMPNIMELNLTGLARLAAFGMIPVAWIWTGSLRAEQPLQISTPHAATMLEADGTLRALQGFGGLWTPGDALATEVADFACGGGRCAVQTDDALVLDSVRWQVPVGDAILSVSPEGNSIAYLPGANRVARADRTRNQVRLSSGIDGLSAADRVLSVRSGSDDTGLVAAVADADSVRIVNQRGAVLNWLPDGTSAVLLLDGETTVYANSKELVYDSPGSSPIRIELDQVAHLRAAGDGFVQVTTADAAYILETRKSHAGRLTRLPTEVRAADAQTPEPGSRTRARRLRELSNELSGESAQ